MKIYTLWIKRKGWDVPELLQAWDEYSVDENPEGFEQACRSSLLSVGSDVETFRYIDLSVDDRDIDSAFENASVGADVLN